MPADSSVTVPLPDNAPVSAAALARQRHLHRRAACGHYEATITQRRAIDAPELYPRIQRNSIRRGFRVEAGGCFAAADGALDGVERQRLAVALDRTADRPQFAAAGKRAAQCLKRDMAAPALQQPGTERLSRIAPRGTDGKCKYRRDVKRVEADLAFDIAFRVERQRQAPAQPRAEYRAIEIIEGQLAAGQRYARRQADVLNQRVGRLETEQGCEVGAANRETDAGPGLRRPGLRGPLRFGVDAGSRYLRFQPQRRAPHAGDGSLKLRRTIARRDRAIEPQ
jgi:hypothetical protein